MEPEPVSVAGSGGRVANGATAKNAAPEILRDDTRTAKKHSSVPQKVPQNNDDEIFAGTDDLSDFLGGSGWRIEQRFYTKKDGTIMLYWNYRSKKPIYINGKRKVPYRAGGKKLWRAGRKNSTSSKRRT